MDPSQNNMPLQFGSRRESQLRADMREDDVSSSTNNPGSNIIAGDGLSPNDANLMNVYNLMNPMLGGHMQPDPNMMMMGAMNFSNMNFGMMGPGGAPMVGPGMGSMGSVANSGNMNPMGGPGNLEHMGKPGILGPVPSSMMSGPPIPVKEIIKLKSSVLYPPPVGSAPKCTRERPPGCRTIFVGGIPDNSSEEILYEVFESCGSIQDIRISKKNFAHIRFENMESVDAAVYISGYRMKINDSDEREDTGRLHVDYATARKDQFEYECQQRAMAREMRHMQRIEKERINPSPPPVVLYSDPEAVLLQERLKSDENLSPVSQILITWLEKGECTRRTANTFYTLIQNVHSHLRRLNSEQETIQQEYDLYKMQHESRIQGITSRFCQIERVLSAAHKQKCWDHFTKPQRKNIDIWQRQTQELRVSQEAKLSKTEELQGNDDMDLSDGEESDDTQPPNKKAKIETFTLQDARELDTLKEENDALKCQLEAFRNEADVSRQENKEDSDKKDIQIQGLKNALQGMQQQLLAKASLVADLKKQVNEKDILLANHVTANDTSESTIDATQADVTSSGLVLTQKEHKMFGLISCFLHVHPHGATIDYLWSYLQQLVPVKVREVEDLLEKMPFVFEQELKGVGAAIERRWISNLYRDNLL